MAATEPTVPSTARPTGLRSPDTVAASYGGIYQPFTGPNRTARLVRAAGVAVKVFLHPLHRIIKISRAREPSGSGAFTPRPGAVKVFGRPLSQSPQRSMLSSRRRSEVAVTEPTVPSTARPTGLRPPDKVAASYGPQELR